LFPYITHCTLEIIIQAAMGVKVNVQNMETNSQYVKAVYDLTERTFLRMLLPWYWSDLLYQLFPAGRQAAKDIQVLHQFTESVINSRRELKKKESINKNTLDKVETKEKKKAFLDMLLDCVSEDGTSLSDLDIREEVDTFMFEGHDTTSSGLAWAIYLIGQHPNVQTKLQEEVDRVLGEKISPNFNDLANLQYLGMVIKESLRMYPLYL